MKKSIELTLEQANGLASLINDAVKLRGLEVAANALFFKDILDKAFAEKPTETKD